MRKYNQIYRFLSLNSFLRKRETWLLFALGIFLQILRNPIQVFEPALYAEDGAWVSMILNYGLPFTLANGRAEYPIWGPILLDWIGVLTSKFFFGNDIKNIANFTAFASFVFFSFVALLSYKNLRDITGSRVAGGLSFLLIIFIPLSEVNTTIGHNLQWGHIAPFVSCMLFLRRHKFKNPLLHDVFQALLCLTLPIVLLNFLMYVAVYLLRVKFIDGCVIVNFRLLIKNLRSNLFLFSILGLAIAFFIFRLDFSMNKSGSAEAIHISGALELVVFRVFLFQFLGYLTQHFNDFLTLLCFIVVFLIPSFAFNFWRRLDRDQIFVILCFLGNLIVFVLLRGGIARVLSYQDTFIHFYFFGLAMYSIFLFSIIIARSEKLVFPLSVVILVVQVAVNFNYIVQWQPPRPSFISWSSSITEGYVRNCGNLECSVPATTHFYIQSNPSGANLHIPSKLIESSVK